tara:strand:- start:6165 stop:6386 length:222 start_codon:yes stop_codon:yes gene_type:complete
MIRLWKLGSLEHKIAPNADSVKCLSKILEGLKGDGPHDIIWGPDIECQIIPDEEGENLVDAIIVVKHEEEVDG